LIDKEGSIMRKKELILIGIILIIACGVYGLNIYLNRLDEGHKKTVNIFIEGKLFKSVDIDTYEEVKIDTEYGKNIVLIDRGKVRMKEASCPDNVCVHMGWISKTIQNIVCLPAKVHVEIAGKEEIGEIDAVSK